MRRSLAAGTFAAFALPAAAIAMPAAPMAPAMAPLAVQYTPPDYPYDPCTPGAPPVRIVQRDEWGRPVQVFVPAYRYCTEQGATYRRPPPYDPAPAYEAPPPRGYDEYGRPIYRRPPAPGWERDPYTGRDMRILR